MKSAIVKHAGPQVMFPICSLFGAHVAHGAFGFGHFPTETLRLLKLWGTTQSLPTQSLPRARPSRHEKMCWDDRSGRVDSAQLWVLENSSQQEIHYRSGEPFSFEKHAWTSWGHLRIWWTIVFPCCFPYLQPGLSKSKPNRSPASVCSFVGSLKGCNFWGRTMHIDRISVCLQMSRVN